MHIDFNKKLTDEEIEYINGLSINELEALHADCEHAIILGETNQISRKTLINSLYGALGAVYFRYYDLRNASAITMFGQLGIRWIARKINEYLNGVCGTEGHNFIIAGDTDSVYVCVDKVVEKIGIDKFKETNDVVEFLSRFAARKMEPAIDTAYRELCDYMNNKEHLMHMDREAISCPPLNSDGIGGMWKAKKRYALNVYDMEGTRFTQPHLKIMGMETQQSSTPAAVKPVLEECIRLLLQEGESSLQKYYKIFEAEYRKLSYLEIADVKTANNISTYDDNGYPGHKCPYHVRGVLTYNRATEGFEGITPVMEGEKVMVLPLREGNPFGDKCISWPSGSQLPDEIKSEVIKWINWSEQFQKTFVKPLDGICKATGKDYEEKATLMDIFGF